MPSFVKKNENAMNRFFKELGSRRIGFRDPRSAKKIHLLGSKAASIGGNAQAYPGAE